MLQKHPFGGIEPEVCGHGEEESGGGDEATHQRHVPHRTGPTVVGVHAAAVVVVVVVVVVLLVVGSMWRFVRFVGGWWWFGKFVGDGGWVGG